MPAKPAAASPARASPSSATSVAHAAYATPPPPVVRMGSTDAASPSHTVPLPPLSYGDETGVPELREMMVEMTHRLDEIKALILAQGSTPARARNSTAVAKRGAAPPADGADAPAPSSAGAAKPKARAAPANKTPPIHAWLAQRIMEDVPTFEALFYGNGRGDTELFNGAGYGELARTCTAGSKVGAPFKIPTDATGTRLVEAFAKVFSYDIWRQYIGKNDNLVRHFKEYKNKKLGIPNGGLQVDDAASHTSEHPQAIDETEGGEEALFEEQ